MKENMKLTPVVKRRALICLLLLVILLTAGGLFWRGRALRERIQALMDRPEPMPSYILGLAPYPGTTYPIDERSKIYWVQSSFLDEVSRGSIICVALDAQVINKLAVDQWTVYEIIPEDSADLLIDNIPVNLLGRGSRVGPIVIAPSIIPTHVVIHYCWKMELAPGDYLATLIIHPIGGEDKRYEWAFTVVNH